MSGRGRAGPVRTLVVWVPDWPVVATGIPPDEPAVVVQANRVVAATPAARAAGVVIGDRRRGAQGRCPEVVVTERDEAAEARAFEPVLRAVEVFTPRLELRRPGSVACGTRGPARYFGGEEAVAHAIARRVDRVLGPAWSGHVGVGVADGVFAATLAARRPRPADGGVVTIVPVGDTASYLAPLPVCTLDRPALVDVLERLGLRTLGAFAAVPVADVLARFGLEGQGAHRLARGLDEYPPALTDPPPELAVAIELDPPAERVDMVAFVARTLADELLERLGSRGLACTRLAVRAESAAGEVHERLWRDEGSLGAGAVVDRVRWQLEGWLDGPAVARPSAGVARLTLTPDEVVPALGRQLGFWGGETAATERAARALARIAGLLGPEAVTVPEWRGGRGPAEQVRLVPAVTVDLTARAQRGARPCGDTPPWPGRVPRPAPALVHPRPIPVEVYDTTGRVVTVDGRGMISAAPARVGEVAVVAWAGPWPAEERWWDAAAARRRARVQAVLADGRAVLLVLEGRRWWIEATYD